MLVQHKCSTVRFTLLLLPKGLGLGLKRTCLGALKVFVDFFFFFFFFVFLALVECLVGKVQLKKRNPNPCFN